MKPVVKPVALGLICKTPSPGKSKTRLSPPLRPEECADISSCFIQDISRTIAGVAEAGHAAGCAVYTPAGSESELRALLPDGFNLVLQGGGDLGVRLNKGILDLLEQGHAGAILVNSDSPTLPHSILKAAVDAVSAGDNVVLSPAIDGGYVLVGLSRPHPRLFEDIAWSTETVYRQTLERAREIDLPVVVLDPWYDVDDAASYGMLEAELAGTRPAFSAPDVPAPDAAQTRTFLHRRRPIAAV